MPKPVSILSPRRASHRLALALGLALSGLLAVGCPGSRSRAGGGASSAAPKASASADLHRPKAQPLAREKVANEAGSLRAGSTPGDPGRVPELEPKNQEVELGPFGIDRLPYPNDPALPPL